MCDLKLKPVQDLHALDSNTSVHGFMHGTSDFFYPIINFSYTKYFVHSYTVDVVFTLS